VDQLWSEGLQRFGGPFLAGDAFTAADAFFAPVAFRVQTVRRQGTPSMQEWHAAALQEPWRDEAHEAETRRVGEWIADLRQPR
jgi:glutathione S-transferase